MYETERTLKMRLYRDSEWNKHLKVMTCREKQRFAQQTLDITFDYVDEKWKLVTPIEHIIMSKQQQDQRVIRYIMCWVKSRHL